MAVYYKGERSFEDVIVEDSSYEDVDRELVQQYLKIMHSDLTGEEALEARGLLKKGHLTNEAFHYLVNFQRNFFPMHV